jgi:hypothetical protein
MKKNIRLELNGGIGDSLKRILISYKIPDYCLKHDAVCHVAYGTTHDCGWENVLRKLCDRTDILRFVDRGEFERLDMPNITDSADPLYTAGRVLPLEFELRDDEDFTLPDDKLNIAIQLRGNDSRKFWSLDKVRRLVDLLKPKYNVWLYDRPEYIQSIGHMFHDVNRFVGDLARCAALVGRCDMLVAPDSWSKYVAQTYDKRMIILCVDVKYMSQDDMFRTCFHGLVNNPKTTLLGFEDDGGLVEHIDQIDVDQVAAALN